MTSPSTPPAVTGIVPCASSGPINNGLSGNSGRCCPLPPPGVHPAGYAQRLVSTAPGRTVSGAVRRRLADAQDLCGRPEAVGRATGDNRGVAHLGPDPDPTRPTALSVPGQGPVVPLPGSPGQSPAGPVRRRPTVSGHGGGPKRPTGCPDGQGVGGVQPTLRGRHPAGGELPGPLQPPHRHQ